MTVDGMDIGVLFMAIAVALFFREHARHKNRVAQSAVEYEARLAEIEASFRRSFGG